MPLIRKSSAQAPARPPDGGEIQNALSSGTNDERWAAARGAADLPDGLAMLKTALVAENDRRVREAIFTSLARIHSPGSVEVILPYLRSDDSGLRTGALDALRSMPEVVAPRLAQLLGDSDPDVRLLACDLVRSQPVADAGRLLSDLLAHDGEANVCAAAVEVLSEIGGPDALPMLARCAARFPDDPFLGFAIRAARDRIGPSPRV